MKFKLVTFLCIAFIFSAAAQKKTTQLLRPKLVVGIVVDQMRWDYLYRYYDRYTNSGFKRMLNEGFTCENNYINYVPTITALGHATVYTGSVPAIHGIAGNDFIINATGKRMYCTEDESVETVGGKSSAGKMSPRNLFTSTIADELRLATNFRSKVIGVALKDRGSILPAGHTANAAYWFDNETGNMISSTYYMKELPKWVQQFNELKLPGRYLKQNWNTLYDLKTYTQSYPDDNPYEGKFAGQQTPTFPIKTSTMFDKDFGILRSVPAGNSYTMEMAKAAVENERMGQHEATDFLAVSFSATDGIGHKMGINSVEVEDTYLRLDKDLGNFLTYLDAKLGKGNYSVFLTADHGAAHNSNLLLNQKIPAGTYPADQVLKDLNKTLDSIYHTANLATFLNSEFYLNYQLLKNNSLDEDAVKKDCIRFLRTIASISYVVDMEKTGDSEAPEEIKTMIRNGYNRERSGAIQIILKPGWQAGSSTGTSHDAWNAYNTHIPLVWMGWGIKQGKTTRETYMTDIAPTLASLLHIQVPNGSIGKTISEVLK